MRKIQLAPEGKKNPKCEKKHTKQIHIEIFASLNQPDTLATFWPIEIFCSGSIKTLYPVYISSTSLKVKQRGP